MLHVLMVTPFLILALKMITVQAKIPISKTVMMDRPLTLILEEERPGWLAS